MELVAERCVYVTKTARTEVDKRAHYAFLKENKAEGAVFKRLDAPYVAGRPNSGGNQVKRKWTHQASFIVASCHATKRSIGLELRDAQGKLQKLGNCTIPTNYSIPAVGEVVEVEYLYAFPGGSVFQPQYKGVRDDIVPSECVMTQLHYKAETVDEDEDN